MLNRAICEKCYSENENVELMNKEQRFCYFCSVALKEDIKKDMMLINKEIPLWCRYKLEHIVLEKEKC